MFEASNWTTAQKPKSKELESPPVSLNFLKPTTMKASVFVLSQLLYQTVAQSGNPVGGFCNGFPDCASDTCDVNNNVCLPALAECCGFCDPANTAQYPCAAGLTCLPNANRCTGGANGDLCESANDCNSPHCIIVGSSGFCHSGNNGALCNSQMDCNDGVECVPDVFIIGDAIVGECRGGGLFSSVCFSGRATVEVKGHGPKQMNELKIGDFVRARDGTYTKIYSFGHYEPQAKAEFLQIHFDADTRSVQGPLEITAEHMLYVQSNSDKTPQLIPAGSVQIGDSLIAVNGNRHAPVTAIETVWRRGVYAPLSEKGEIAVNGVLASNYVYRSWLDSSKISGATMHLLQHGVMTVHRLYENWVAVQWEKKESYDETTGFSPVVSFWYELEQWLLRQGLITRSIFFFLLLPFAIFFLVAGQVNMLTLGAILPVAGLVWWWQSNNELKTQLATLRRSNQQFATQVQNQATHAVGLLSPNGNGQARR